MQSQPHWAQTNILQRGQWVRYSSVCCEPQLVPGKRGAGLLIAITMAAISRSSFVVLDDVGGDPRVRQAMKFDPV